MYKLAQWRDQDWQAFSHPPVYSQFDGPAGKTRIIATAPGSDPVVFESLTRCLATPLILLYVLHTPRGEAKPGRYQSELLDRAGVEAFLGRFRDFLQTDTRFDLWVHAPEAEATIVWDRHDLIHLYGMTASAIPALRALGFTPGDPKVDFVHAHNYHAANDPQAKALLEALDWHWSPLRPEDEQ